MSYSLILLAFVVPLIVLTFSYWRYSSEISIAEYFACAIIGYVLSVGVLFGVEKSYEYGQAYDNEILNGQVTEKYSEKVSCEHEYVCGETCSGTGKHRSCSPRYCHLHSYDVDWVVKTTVGDMNIDRVNSRGDEEPPRFTATQVGEPASAEYGYVNKLLLDDNTLFSAVQADVSKFTIPAYPVVYDYYRINRVFNDTAINTSAWNSLLNDWLKNDGSIYQLNVIVFVTNRPETYADAVLYSWKGGKKNDVILFIGEKDGKVSWFKSTSYARGAGNSRLHAQLLLTAMGEQVDDKLLNLLYKTTTQYYKRFTMEQFVSMVNVQPHYPWGIYVVVLMLTTGIMFGLVYLAMNNNIRGNTRRTK